MPINALKNILFGISLVFTFPVYAIDVVSDPILETNSFTEIARLIDQIEQLRQQTNALQQELKALDGSQYQWSNAQDKINQLANTMNQSHTLAYSAKELNDRFKQLFPGYKAPDDFDTQYQDITLTSLNTLNQIMQSLGASADNFQSESDRLAFLQAQSQRAEGQMQAIQAATQIASEQVTQLQLLRQVLIAQANAQNTYYAQKLQKEASEVASTRQFLTANHTEFQTLEEGHQIKEPN